MPEIFYSTGAHEDASPHELLFFCPEIRAEYCRDAKKGNENPGAYGAYESYGNNENNENNGSIAGKYDETSAQRLSRVSDISKDDGKTGRTGGCRKIR